MALICSSKLVRTTRFQAGYVTYEDSLAWGSFGTAVTGTVLLWVPDPHAPGTGHLYTTTKIYKLNIGARTATLCHTWSATLQSVSADASIGTPHYLAIGYIAGTGSIAAYSTNGTTFTEATVTSNFPTDGSGLSIQNGCYVSHRVAGKALTSVFTSTDTADPPSVTRAGRQTADYGATWSSVSNPAITTGITLAATLHLPIHDNDAESIAYYTYIGSISGDHRLQRANGASITDISPEIGGNDYTPRTARDGICTSVHNRQRVLTVAQSEASSNYAAFLSSSAGDAWATILGDGTNARRGALAGDNPDRGWVWGVSDHIQQLTISGSSATFDDKSGNLSTHSAGAEIIAIAGWAP
jgi:hypothetical protein